MLNNIYELLFDKVFTFKGRSSRKEYVCKTILTLVTTFTTGHFIEITPSKEATFYTFLYLVTLLILLLSSFYQYFPLAVRRLHDFNVSGWWILFSFAPYSQLILVLLAFKKGTEGINNYGEPPKY